MHFDLKFKSYLFRPKHMLDHFISETAFDLQLHRFQQKTGETIPYPESYRYFKLPFSSNTHCDQIYVGIISYYLHENHESSWVTFKNLSYLFQDYIGYAKGHSINLRLSNTLGHASLIWCQNAAAKQAPSLVSSHSGSHIALHCLSLTLKYCCSSTPPWSDSIKKQCHKCLQSHFLCVYTAFKDWFVQLQFPSALLYSTPASSSSQIHTLFFWLQLNNLICRRCSVFSTFDYFESLSKTTEVAYI